MGALVGLWLFRRELDRAGLPNPWAVAFPEGLPPTLERVHPTQLYEAMPLFIIGSLLLGLRRRRLDDRVVLGRTLPY